MILSEIYDLSFLRIYVNSSRDIEMFEDGCPTLPNDTYGVGFFSITSLILEILER